MLRNFSFIIGRQLAGCAHPDSMGRCDEALEELRDHGIGAIVSLDEIGLPLHLIADYGFHYLHLAMPDFGVPTPGQAEQFVEFVRREFANSNAVVVHCGAGYGRTGTMLACFLVSEGKSPQEAVSIVRKSRPGSVETFEQEDFVFQFAAILDKKKAAGTKTRRAPRKKPQSG